MTDGGSGPRPPFDPARIVELDVRALLRAGGEPLAGILEALATLPPGGVLHLRTTFQPVPLIRLLAAQGIRSASERFGEEDWSTWCWRGDPPAAAAPRAAPATEPSPAGVSDLRSLPPPGPLLHILERLEAGETTFDVHLPFFPEPALPMLARVGATAELVLEGSDGVQVRIRRV